MRSSRELCGTPPLQLQPPTAAGAAAQPQTDAVAAQHAAAVAAGWLWDAEWQQYYDPVEAEQQNEADKQLLDDSERIEVRYWLYEQIEELEICFIFSVRIHCRHRQVKRSRT